MKKTIGIISCLIIVFQSFSQIELDKKSDTLLAEGRRLYKSEMASWYGTDIFLGQYKDKDRIGGYFSYSGNDGNKCIFFSRGDTPRVIGTIAFDDTYNVQTAKADLTERELTDPEHELCMLRIAASKMVSSDTLFKYYEHTNLNLIPLITGNERKVYILTGPQQTDIVIFGNDYLLTFDKENKIITKQQLHRNIISINYGGKAAKGEDVVGTMHTHQPETGDFITPTDICTLMLYEKFAKWKQHVVVSANYVSIWDCEKDQLVIISKEAMDKINKSQENHRKK
jgi:hypothetical protein